MYGIQNATHLDNFAMAALLFYDTNAFNIYESATYAAIAERESGFRPNVFNSDSALGLMQLIFTVQSSSRLKEEIEVYDLNKKTEKVKVFNLYDKSAKEPPDFDGTFGIEELEKIDDRFWIPKNQIRLVVWQVGRKNAPAAFPSKYENILWSNWGDAPWGRDAGKQTAGLGVLTAVRSSTVRHAVEFLGGKWSDYVLWAAGEGPTKTGALVDESTYGTKRPNNLSEEPAEKVKAPYRNWYDVMAWCYPQEIYQYMEKDNSVKAHLKTKFNITDAEYESKVLKKWKTGRGPGAVPSGESRTFYFSEDYFGDNGKIWTTLKELRNTDE